MSRFVRFRDESLQRSSGISRACCDSNDSLSERWTIASLLDRVCFEGYEADHLQGES